MLQYLEFSHGTRASSLKKRERKESCEITIPSTPILMASSSNSLIATNAIGHPVTERLTKTNYPLWKLQVLPALHGAQLIGYVDGTVQAPAVEIDDDKEKKKVPNPAYVQWLTQGLQLPRVLAFS